MPKLPKNWVKAPIGALCRLINGRAFKPSEWSDQGLPIVRIQNLNNPSAAYNYFDGEIEADFIVEPGDLLFAWSGTPGTSFGAHVWQGSTAVLNQHIFKVVIDQRLLVPEYFKLAINHVLDELIEKAHGAAGLRHITRSRFEETPIALPPYEEQKRIAQEAHEIKSRVESALSHLEKTERAATSYMAEAYSQAFANDAVHDVVPFESLIEDGPTNGWSPSSGSDARGTLTLRLSATTSGQMLLTPKTTKRIYEKVPRDSKFWLEPGDLLVQRANSLEYVGAAAIYDGPPKTYIYPDLMMRVRARGTPLRYYLLNYLNSPVARRYLQDRASGTAGNMPKISGATLRQLPVPLPPNGSYDSVNRQLKRARQWVAKIVEKASGARANVHKLHRDCLSAACSGELVEQDPAEGNARDLLLEINAWRDNEMAKAKARKVRRMISAKSPLITETETTRASVGKTHLRDTLLLLGKKADARTLWKKSGMSIDEFYKQLRSEIRLKLICEGSRKDRLVISDEG